MERVHKLSPALALPEYDLYGVPPTQLIVDRDITTEHRPISVINDSSSPIQFEIHTAVDEYINLSKSEIKISMKISISKANLGTDKDVKKEPQLSIHTMPFEIKTGRSIAGMEHRAQTMLYTLLAAERYGVEQTLVLYPERGGRPCPAKPKRTLSADWREE